MNDPLDGTGERTLAGFTVSLSAAVVVKANNEKYMWQSIQEESSAKHLSVCCCMNTARVVETSGGEFYLPQNIYHLPFESINDWIEVPTC